MESDNKFGLNDSGDNINDVVIEGEDGITEKEYHSYHGSHTHHSSHSHHSDRHSSQNKRKKNNKNDKKSVPSRIDAWINKKFSASKIMVFSVCMLFIAIVTIGVIYVYETNTDYNVVSDISSANSGFAGNQSVGFSDYSTNVTVPTYWKDMIEEKTEKVKALQADGGKDCVSFVWASDTHIPDNHTSRTSDIGILMAKMMYNCDIPYAVLTGDVGTRASFETEEELERAQAMIPLHLAPLWGSDRLLVAIGNHDGCYGDSSCYYEKQFSPERMWEIYFRKQALDSRRVFSEDGTYFYVDDHTQKLRYIILNSQYGGEYLVDENGIAVNNRFSVSCYGQKQLDWLADVALDMPEGYGAVLMSHVPPKVLYSTHKVPYTVDCGQICGIIDAYNNKTTFKGSYTEGVDGWSNSDVSVDFTNAKGEIIAMFTGHVHMDTIDTTTLTCPLITIISAGASVNLGENPERTFFTDQETSFDVVTINRKTRTIYCTRVGSGEDRNVQY